MTRIAAVVVSVFLIGCGTEPVDDTPPLNPAAVFVDVTAWAGVDPGPEWIPGSGVAFVDVDADGRDDIALSGRGATRVLRNVGGRFELWTDLSHPDMHSQFIYAIDVNRDGRDDLLIVALEGVMVWVNGTAGFERRDALLPADSEDREASTATFGDYTGDGALDIYLAHMWVHDDTAADDLCADDAGGGEEDEEGFGLGTPASDRLLTSDGDGFAEEALTGDATLSQSALTVDLNGDGRLDVVVATELFAAERVLLGTDDGLTAAPDALGIDAKTSAKGLAVGDMNGDGHLDLWATEQGDFGRDRLYVYSPADGGFVDRGGEAGLDEAAGATAWGVALQDFDHDGDLDAYLANGVPEEPDCEGGDEPNALLFNLGNATFGVAKLGAESGLSERRQSRGVAVSDIDGDGDLDLLVANLDGPVTLLRNDVAAGHWLQVRVLVEGMSPAVGAVVTVTAGNKKHVRAVVGAPSYGGSSTHTLHFGLGQASAIDRIDVRFPDGSTTTLSSDVDRVVTVAAGPSR